MMTFFEESHRYLVGNVVFPVVNFTLNRKGISGLYRSLLITEQASQEVLRELQFQKLRTALQHAYRWIPFYTKRFREVGLVPEDIRTLEDVRHIPPLAREDIVNHRMDLIDIRYRDSIPRADRSVEVRGSAEAFAGFRKRPLVKNATSGSSGTPTVFYEDGSTTALSWAHELRLKHWFGLAPGVKEARMSATSTEYAAGSKFASAREWMWNQTILPGYFLSDCEYELCLRKIRQVRPRVLWGPTPGLAGLAHYARSTGVDISRCRPDVVISRAAPLYSHEKKLLAEVFGCPITNIYGTREVGHVAMNCPHGSIHVNQENYIVEIEEASAGEQSAGLGTLLVTPLFESPMPFLRYRIDDLVELGGSDCPCGRSLITFRKIVGRSSEVFKTKDGRMIAPNFWCIAFEEGRLSGDVERFQVVYRRNDLIRLRIVPRPRYSPETETELREFFRKNFPANMELEIEYVSEIKPQPSGKYVFVVNEVAQQPEHLARV
jgi:phenylacetate-CoA ligase